MDLKIEIIYQRQFKKNKVMAFEPDKITRSLIQKAVEKIDNEKIQLDPSTKFDVIINNKAYPPKEIMRYAHELFNGERIWEFSGGEPTNKYFKDLGFEIKEKSEIESVSYYVLGSVWNGEDQFERFVKNSIWENGSEDQFLDIVNNVKVGDRVAIKSSFAREKLSILRVKSTGTVISNDQDGQTLRVKWDSQPPFFDLEGFGTYRKTIQKVTGEAIDKIFNHYSEINLQTTKTEINMSLNSIMYGPPGTGKTYNSIDKAVAIATGSSSDHVSNKKQFDELRKQGQIEFVTFHQNYSYEDFMVGIRPNIDETTSNLSFKKHYGIFYEIVKRAKENYENSLKDENIISKENWVKKKFDEFINNIRETLENGNDYKIGSKFPERKVLSIENDIYYQQSGEKGVPRHMDFNDIIFAYLDDNFDNKDIQANNRLTNTARNTGLTQYYVDILNQFRDFAGRYEERYNARGENKVALKNFVLIIDEINRANISKVFGELITLLEDDKRLGKPNELKITLPNGEKEFGVPPNLYLIGTMNTADKSIALIDIALRRRFEFMGYYPNYDVLKPEAKILLQRINEEIYKLKNSADYLIGHAYFMQEEKIETILKNKVIPLLMEYFSAKTKIVSDIFNNTDWKVEYDTTKFDWLISQR